MVSLDARGLLLVGPLLLDPTGEIMIRMATWTVVRRTSDTTDEMHLSRHLDLHPARLLDHPFDARKWIGNRTGGATGRETSTAIGGTDGAQLGGNRLGHHRANAALAPSVKDWLSPSR